MLTPPPPPRHSKLLDLCRHWFVLRRCYRVQSGFPREFTDSFSRDGMLTKGFARRTRAPHFGQRIVILLRRYRRRDCNIIFERCVANCYGQTVVFNFAR